MLSSYGLLVSMIPAILWPHPDCAAFELRPILLMPIMFMTRKGNPDNQGPLIHWSQDLPLLVPRLVDCQVSGKPSTTDFVRLARCNTQWYARIYTAQRDLGVENSTFKSADLLVVRFDTACGFLMLGLQLALELCYLRVPLLNCSLQAAHLRAKMLVQSLKRQLTPSSVVRATLSLAKK